MARVFWTGAEGSRLLQRAGWALEAALLYLLWGLVRLFPVDRASRLGGRIMQWIGLRSKKNRHVLANLRVAFPDRDEQTIRRLAAGSWANLGSVLAEFVHLDRITAADSADPRIDVVYEGCDAGSLRRDGPCIIITAHLANWELVAFVGQQACGSLDAIYSPQNNLYLEHMVQRMREPLRCTFYGKVNAVRAMFRSLKRGRSIGLLADVRVDGGTLVPFFGMDAESTTTPAWLSLKTGCRIVPVHVERLRDAHFRITLGPPLRAERGEGETDQDALLRTTLAINHRIEDWIRAHPEQWLCTKRRWPKPAMEAAGADRPRQGQAPTRRDPSA